MKILVTAFEPFGGDETNPSQTTLQLLADQIGSAQISKLVLPVVFYEATEKLCQAIENIKPDAVVSLGLAGGRQGISVERIAINLIDARIADNAGNQPRDLPIINDGPAAYFSSLPVREIVENLQKDDLPAHISYSAGTFVCNQVMYGLLDYLHEHHPSTIGGFIHLPYLDSLVKDDHTAFLTQAQMSQGVETAIRTIIESIEK